MIYITGDTHGGASCDLDKLTMDSLDKNRIRRPTAEDILIICGDFGFPFLGYKDRIKYKLEDEYKNYMQWFRTYPCEVYFIDGNHDNHPFWNSQPVIERFGGRMHRHPDAPNVYHMMRGEVYEIEEQKIFTFGGAVSADKVFREPGFSWWPEEQATEEDFQNALKNLKRVDWQVDIVITHTLPMSVIKTFNLVPAQDRTSNYLDMFYNDRRGKDNFSGIDFTQWYCGHFHEDRTMAPGIRCCYQDVIIV